MMHDETEDCPTGLYLSFKYDYNLQRADMFNDHVGAVSVYVFDETGHYVTCREVKNEGDYRPLADPLYAMHMDLAPGRYQFLVLAGQCCYDDMLASDRACFLRALPESGDSPVRGGRAFGVRIPYFFRRNVELGGQRRSATRHYMARYGMYPGGSVRTASHLP